MAQKIELQYEGAAGDLFKMLDDLVAGNRKLGAVHKETHEGIQDDLKDSTKGVKDFSGAMGSAAQIVGAISKTFAQGASNFKALSAAAEQARIEYEQLAGALQKTTEEKKRINAAIASNKREFDALNKTLQESGVKSKEITSAIAANRSAYADLSKQLAKVSADEVLLKNNVSDASKALVSATKAVEQAANGNAGVIATLQKNLQQVGDITKGVSGALSDVEKADLSRINTQLRAVADQEKIIVQEISAEKKARIDALVEAKKITQEEAKLLSEVTAVVDTLKEMGKVPPPVVPVEKVQSLRAQYLAAVRAAQDLAQTPGPQFDAALAEAARLKELIDDTKQSISTLNPDDKVAAFSQLGNAIAGGAQAVSGFAIALGDNNSALQESLFKFQSVLFGIQGAQTFLKDFSDSFANLRRVLGLTTAAQVTNTVATEADIVAKGGQATATTGAAVATGGLTAALNTLKVAIATNPFTALLVAAAAVVALFVALSDSAEEAELDVDALLKRLQDLKEFEGAAIDLRRELDALSRERQQISGDDTPEKQRALALQAQREELEALAREQALVKADQDELTRQLEALDPKAKDNAEKRKQLSDAIEADVKEFASFAGKRQKLAESTANQLLRIGQKEVEDAKALAKTRRDIAERLTAELIAANKALEDALAGLELDAADPNEQLNLQREAALEEVRILEEKALKAKAILELQARTAQEIFENLSEKEKEARADALIAQGIVKPDTRNEEAAAAARLAIWDKYFDDLRDLERTKRQERATAILDPFEQERTLFDINLKEREKSLREAGATEAEIEQAIANDRLNFRIQQTQKALDLDEKTAQAEVDIINASGDKSKQAERAKQLALLQVQVEFAEARLALVEQLGTAEGDAAAAQLRGAIAKLKGEIDDLKSQDLDLNLLDLFGIAPKDQDKVRDALNMLGSSLKSILDSYYQGQLDALEGQINITDELIADAQRRTDELENQLDREVQNQKEGLANNVDNIKKAIAAVKAEEKEAIAEKKRLQAEAAKIAKQQATIEAVIQTAKMITTAAQMIASGAEQGGWVGALLAAAAVAGVIATFVAAQQSIKSATASQATFGEGGWIEGKPHSQGGTPIVAEKGEFVVKAAQAQKHPELMEAINDDSLGSLSQRAIEELLRGANIRLDRTEIQKVIEVRDRYIMLDTRKENEATAKEVRLLRGQVAELQATMSKEKDEVRDTPNGREVRRGNTTRTVR